jgi:hypothetical protein
MSHYRRRRPWSASVRSTASSSPCQPFSVYGRGEVSGPARCPMVHHGGKCSPASRSRSPPPRRRPSRRCCIKRSSRSLPARLSARSNLGAQLMCRIGAKAVYCLRHPATVGGLAARLEPCDGRSAAQRARDGLMQQCPVADRRRKPQMPRSAQDHLAACLGRKDHAVTAVDGCESGACRPVEDRSDIAGGDAAVSVHAAEAIGRVAGAITGHSRHGRYCKRRPSRYVHRQSGYAATGVE